MSKKLKTVLELRKSLGLNQTEFWTKIGVTQSCGSRYENDRAMPKPVLLLLEIIYGWKQK